MYRIGEIKPVRWSVDERGCWNCTSHSLKPLGYPSLYDRFKRKVMPMHRYLYKELFGDVPSNIFIRHKCDNRACINPEHWEPGTPRDNVYDMIHRGGMVDITKYHARGEQINTAKLTTKEVIEIRESREPNRILAEKYGVEKRNIWCIKSRRTWKHVK